jgi:hypothetical protein
MREKFNEIAAEVGNGHKIGKGGRQGGRVAGFAYLNSPRDARALLTRVMNLMIAGNRRDENYKLAMDVWELQIADWERNKRVGPAPPKPGPPKLDPRVVTAAANAIRTWLICKDSELEELLKEVNETNQKLLDIIAASERQAAVAGHSNTEIPMSGSGCSPVTTLRRMG